MRGHVYLKVFVKILPRMVTSKVDTLILTLQGIKILPQVHASSSKYECPSLNRTRSLVTEASVVMSLNTQNCLIGYYISNQMFFSV